MVRARDCRKRHSSFEHAAHCADVRDRDGSAWSSTARHRGSHADARPFADQCALEFGEGSKYVQDHPPSRRAGVYRLRERAERGAGLLDAIDDRQKVREGSRDAIELVDRQAVARAQRR